VGVTQAGVNHREEKDTLGVGQARRAWLTKEQIVNTRPWSKVKK